jgi:hypothetical protein
VERYDGTKERFWRERCETVFTHLVTIFTVESLWGCFVHFVGFANYVVPVVCAMISFWYYYAIFGFGGMFWVLLMIESLFLMCSDLLLDM